jgi:hypothetical protein
MAADIAASAQQVAALATKGRLRKTVFLWDHHKTADGFGAEYIAFMFGKWRQDTCYGETLEQIAADMKTRGFIIQWTPPTPTAA